MVLAGAAVSLIGCKESPYILVPGDNSNNQDSIYVAPDPIPDPDPEGIDIPEGTINVNEAVKLCNALAPGATSEDIYYIKGWVTSVEDNVSAIEKYGNASYHIAACTSGSTKQLYVYQSMGLYGSRFQSAVQVAEGDFVIIRGKLKNYGGVCETEERGGSCLIYSTNELIQIAAPTPAPEGVTIPEGTLTVKEALIKGLELGKGNTTTEKYYIKGYVSRLDAGHASAMSGYGNGVFYIADNKDGEKNMEFEAYQVYGKNGTKFTAAQAEAIEVGDFVILYGQITNYNGTIETVGRGASYVYYSTNPKW